MSYGPEGDPATAKIVFVGEAPSTQEILQGRPFVGPAGYVFAECLNKAGILRSECYITNVFQEQVRKKKGKQDIFDRDGDKLFSNTKVGFTELGMVHIRELEEQLSKTNANVYVPLGVPAFRALCGPQVGGITKWRGSIMRASLGVIQDKKAIPSIHPAMALHGQYINRYLITSDFKRTLREANFPEIRRPPYQFKLRPTFNQCMEYLDFLETLDEYVSDIEIGFVSNEVDPIGQITRISFAWEDYKAISIPYGDGGWSEEQEIQLWLKTAELYEKPGPLKWFHNGAFDIQVIFFIHGVLVAPPYGDTMVAHSVVYPDFLKNLAFCASIHTDQPYWKHMVKHGDMTNPEG